MSRVNCAQKIFGAATGSFKRAARRHRGGLNGPGRKTAGVETSEVSGGNGAPGTSLECRQRNGVQLCTAEIRRRQAEGICADVKAIAVSADQRLVSKATGRAPPKAGVSVIRHIQRYTFQFPAGLPVWLTAIRT